MITNQAYTILNDDNGKPSMLLVEIQFTRVLIQEERIFSELQKRNILRSIVAVIFDMVPN